MGASQVKILSRILRIIAVGLLVAAVLDIKMDVPRTIQDAVILTDISESMDPALRDSLLAKARSVFGPDTPVRNFSDNSGGKENRSQTNLEFALRDVAEEKVVLISDGWENQGSVRNIFPTLEKKEKKIFPLIPDNQQDNLARRCEIISISAPLVAPRQTSVAIQATIRNDRTKICRGTLEFFHGEKSLKKESVELQPESEIRLTESSDATQEGLQRLRAIFVPEDGTRSEESRYLSSTDREKILVISGAELDNRFLKPALENQSFRVDFRVGSTQPEDQKNIRSYAAVILNNVAIKQLSRDFLISLKDAVAQGTGLVTFGGERGYGLGGYRDSVIEEAMPLESLPPQTEEKRLNVAVQLVVDKSQSMATENRLDFVKSAAAEVIKSLKPDDYLGVIGFDSQPFVVVPIGRIQDIREQALSQIQNIFPTGSTRLLRALQDAGRLIERVPAGRKHIIVLTDGRLPDAGPMYLELTKQLRISGITLSSVLLSDESGNYPLKEMADIGGGVFYVTQDPTKLPRIFLEDIKVSTGEKTMREAQEYQIKRGPAGIISTELAAFPTLKGYVQTKARENALVELLVAGQSVEPLLASWSFSQGKVISFTSDIYGRWSDQWIGWAKFPQFLRDLILASAEKLSKDTSIRFDLRPIIQGDQVQFDLSFFNQDFPQGVSATVIRPNGEKTQIAFNQRKKGSYQSALDHVNGGDYRIEIQANKQNLPPVIFHIEGSLFGEEKGKGFNIPLLTEIAGISGGEINPIKAPKQEQVLFDKYPLSPWLFLASLAVLLLEIIVREGAFGRRPQ